ncbi:MAG: hypothetical protein AB1777_08270 [Bacteroidota bacterium]
MKPIKFLERLSYWLLRLTFVGYIVLSNMGSFKSFNIADVQLYIALALVVFGVLLIIGGMTKNQGLTVISSVGTFLILVYKALTPWPPAISDYFLLELVLVAVALVFASKGN